jgi:thiamine transport system ATP-binding protein
MLRLDGVQIVQGEFHLSADIEIAQGRKTAVIGPSGAGKSTLLAALSGFAPLQAGRIFWNDQDITNTPPGRRPMSMLFQDNNLFPHLDVTQNVGLGINGDLRLGPRDRAAVEDAINRVGLSSHAKARAGTLSGGQQSRAALARVLVQRRPLVLLDEPFAALGPAMRRDMLYLVAGLISEAGATMLMVTHAPEDARHIAHDVVFVAEGHAHAPRPVAEVLDNPPPALRAYLG